MTSDFFGSLKSSNLADILRVLVDSKRTGCLKFSEGDQEGIVVIENGIILNARTGGYTALHALFKFVGWRDARLDFMPGELPGDLSRDLAVYDPIMLIAGVDFKEQELTLLQQATPPIDSVPQCVAGEALDSVEATPADRGLLMLADGHRSVREIATMVKLSPLEVARILARFRLAGALKLVPCRRTVAKSAMAGAG